MRSILAILFACWATVAPAQVPAPTFAALAYGPSPAQVFDIRIPGGSTRAHHAVLMIHGGGFHSGSRHDVNPALVTALLARGYAVVTVDYRLSGEALFPAAVEDIFAAMVLLRDRADDWKLTGKIFVYGESAGGHLAALTGTAFNDATFRKSLPGNKGSVRPDGVIALYPPVDFARLDPMLRAQGCDAAAINHGAASGAESRWLGAPLATLPDKVRQANPVTHISGFMPAFLIQTGARDCVVGAGQGGILADAIRAWNLRVTHEVMPDAGHGGAAFESDANIARIIAFLDDH